MGRNIAIIMFFNFLHFFGIPYSVSGWNGSEREFFFSLILSLSRLILAWNEATMMFSDFLNFFAIFLEFLILGRVGMDRNENFFFSHSRPVPSSFGLKWSHNDVLWIFKFFYYFFGIPYSRSGWNGSEWEYFCSLILSWSSPVLALKEAILMFFNFLIFLLFFRNSIFRIG